MKKRTALRIALGGTAAAIAMVPGVAAADTKSFQGDDYSVDTDGRRRMETCDRESDEQQVHSDVRNQVGGESGNFTRDGDGNNGNCASRWVSSSHWEATIAQHRTVEERDFAPDLFGNWVAT